MGYSFHGRDHTITHGHAFCQRLAWETYKATFGDTNVHEQLPMQPSQAEAFLRSTTSRLFPASLQVGCKIYVRPVYLLHTSFSNRRRISKQLVPSSHMFIFLYAKLFRAAAIALGLILRCVCPRSFGLDTLPSILQKMTMFLQQLPDDADPVVYNQDLVGFFTFHSCASHS